MPVGHWLEVLRRHPRPWRLVAAHLLRVTGLWRFVTVPGDGYRLRMYPSNTTLNLWIGAGPRVHGLELFTDYCRPGDVVIDVGANVGEVSLIASSRVGPAGRVIAFEPVPRTFGFLRGNLAFNGRENVDARNLAVGAEPGTVQMSNDKRDDMNRIVERGIGVRCSTLDGEVPGEAPVALLKVDVEGAELRVLEGGPSLLARTACVNCEMGEAHHRRYGYGMSDLIAHLSARGFETFVIGPGRRLRRVDASFAEPGGHELVGLRDPRAFRDRTGWTIA